MIKYKLICKDCELIFDSWFASSDEFEKLRKRKILNCHKCNSKSIEKTLMAPKLITKSVSEESQKELKKLRKISKKIKEYQKYIRKNFQYVGKNFAYEARSLHYDNKKENGIYGTASKEEIQELREEGINAETIPWIEDKNN